MPFTLTMPKLSPTMDEGTLAKWHKKEGDQIEAGELLIEVSTDKATVEYNALDSGWLRKILKKEGETALVNEAIAICTEKREESIEGYVPEGIKIEKSSVETVPLSSTAKEMTAEKPLEKSAKQGIAIQPSFVPEAPIENYTFEYPSESLEERLLASPLARKIAKEKGVDLSTVKGTGPNQRVMSRDLELAQPAGKVSFGNRAVPQIAPGSFEEESLTQMRKVIGQRLQEAKMFVPHFYVSVDINAESLVQMREQLRTGEIKVTFNDFIIKACALALREHPNVNSGFNSVNNTIIRFKTIDIAIAVSIPAGLITPIIRHADFKNLGELSVEANQLSKKAKDGKLKPQEYKGGSFTISNLGMFGVSNFQAIINPPQAAILAVSGIRDVPVVKKGEVVPGKVLTVTLSADHRVIDGVAGAQFLKTLQKYLENPALLIV